jgi:hypothetical protein
MLEGDQKLLDTGRIHAGQAASPRHDQHFAIDVQP